MASVTSNSIPGVINAEVTAYNENVTRLAVASGNRLQVLSRSEDLQIWQLTAEWQTASSSRTTEVLG